MNELLSGKTVRKMLNDHEVEVVLPTKKISYPEGKRELQKLFKKLTS